MKVWQVTDCDWVMAHTKQEAIETLHGFCEIDVEESEVRELTESEMNTMTYLDDMEDPTSETRTFAEELRQRLAAGETKPDYFATSEY